jgi:hypothetical protein
VKVCVAGSRGITSEDVVFSCIERSCYQITEIVSGKAVGVDTVGEVFAQRAGLPVKEFLPNWRIGKNAGHIRNERMAEYCDAAVIVWNGSSNGTRNMIGHLTRLGKLFTLWDAAGNACLWIDGKMVRSFDMFWGEPK